VGALSLLLGAALEAKLRKNLSELPSQEVDLIVELAKVSSMHLWDYALNHESVGPEVTVISNDTERG
jgi:hypothetical protein